MTTLLERGPGYVIYQIPIVPDTPAPDLHLLAEALEGFHYGLDYNPLTEQLKIYTD